MNEFGEIGLDHLLLEKLDENTVLLNAGRLCCRCAATLLAHWPNCCRAWKRAKCGVSGYDRQALDDDYRRAVLWQIATPVWQAAYNIRPLRWLNHMERIMLAVDDLGCRELLR